MLQSLKIRKLELAERWTLQQRSIEPRSTIDYRGWRTSIHARKTVRTFEKGYFSNRRGEAAIQDSLACRARSSGKKMISTESAFQDRPEHGFRNHIESRQRMVMAQWESGIETRIQR